MLTGGQGCRRAAPPLPVKTTAPIPKGLIPEAARLRQYQRGVAALRELIVKNLLAAAPAWSPHAIWRPEVRVGAE